MQKQQEFRKVLMQEQPYFHGTQPFIWLQQVQKVSMAQKQDMLRSEELNSNDIAEKSQAQHEHVCADLLEIEKTKLLQTYALYAIIQEVCPTMIEQSIQYLFRISRSWSQDKKISEKFTMQSIKNYIYSFSCNRFGKFYELSMKILVNRIQQIIKNYQQGMNEESMNIRIEIFAHYIKNIVEFHEYLPKKKKTEYLKPHCLIKTLNIPKECYSSLKIFYTESKREQIQFFDDQKHHISLLINTFYILQLRNKCEVLAQDFKELSFCINQTPQAFLKEKINHLKACKKQSIQKRRSVLMRETPKTFSEAFVLLNKRQKVKLSSLSLEEIEQQASIFQYLLKSKPRQIKNHEQLRYLTAKYKKTMDSYCVKFGKYALKMKQYGDLNIDMLKDKYISDRLLQDAHVAYQKICKGAYQFLFIFISRKYFDDNIDRLLRKQCRYRQMCYLQQLINLIQSQKDKKQFIFLQKYQLSWQDDKCQNEKAIFFAAVSTRGINYSKVINNSPNFQRTFFNQLIKKVEKSSIILSNDPTLQLEGHFNGKIQKRVYVLPCLKASYFPNPCEVIYQMILQSLKILRKSNKDKYSLKSMVQAFSNWIICEFGGDIVDVEIDFSTQMYEQYRSKDQISDIKTTKYEQLLSKKLINSTDSLMLFDTQGLRKYLHAIKLYSLRIISIQAKQIKN